MILTILFAMIIGTGLGQNPIRGDGKAFKQALEQDGFTVQQGGLGYFDLLKYITTECCLLHTETIPTQNI